MKPMRRCPRRMRNSRQRRGRGPVVDAHGVHVRQCTRRRDGGDVDLRQHRASNQQLRAGRCEQQSLDATASHAQCEFLQRLPGETAARPQDELCAQACSGIECRKQNFAEKRNLLAGVDQCDTVRTTAGQPAGFVIRDVAGTANRLTNERTGFRTDLAGAVDDIRNSHHGNASPFGNGTDCHRRTAATPLPCRPDCHDRHYPPISSHECLQWRGTNVGTFNVKCNGIAAEKALLRVARDRYHSWRPTYSRYRCGCPQLAADLYSKVSSRI